MSIKHNVAANYISQIYVTLIGIIMVPMYVKYMGAEAYGLVGFFAMLQAWFQLLDMGLTPTMARETARFNGGATDALSLRRLLRAMEGVFVGLAILGCTALMAGADYIASSWLKVEQLPLAEVQHAIMLIAIIVALRWVCGLYRGAISGFERLVWLSGFNIAVATGRFLLVIPLLIYIGATPSHFFGFQLGVAAIELITLILKTYSLLSRNKVKRFTKWQWEPLKNVLGFSAAMAFTTSSWIMATQLDKLILSKLLTLSNYAEFTIATLIASGILLISTPINSAIIPRLTKINAEVNTEDFYTIYENATQIISIITIPLVAIFAYYSYEVLWAWTGDRSLAENAAPILRCYAIGYGLIAICSMTSHLQVAKGDLKLHVIGSGIYIIFLSASLALLVNRYGVAGAGYAWLITNVMYSFLWIPIIHNKFLKTSYINWATNNVVKILPFVVLTCIGLSQVGYSPETRQGTLTYIIFVYLCLLTLATVSSSYGKEHLVRCASDLKGRLFVRNKI